MDLLFVCTGNQCRSPMAQALLTRRLAAWGVDGVRVHSAGLLGDGAPATPLACQAVPGLDAHLSRSLSRALIACADLVLGMAREHVREVVVVAPEAFSRTFSLKELIRRAAQVGPRPPSERLEAWLARVGAGRTVGEMIGSSPLDDVADPIGQPAAVYRRTAEELDGLVAQLAHLLWSDANRDVAPGLAGG